MKEKNEMSLDEVLSSIKKMVVDKEPPVLDLTDMISKDGTIVKVKKNNGENKDEQDMGTFLKLIQENQDTIVNQKNASQNNIDSQNHERKTFSKQKSDESQDNLIIDIIKETLSPILQNWVKENLHTIVSEMVEKEVKAFIYQHSQKK